MTLKETFHRLRWIPKYFYKQIYITSNVYTKEDIYQELNIALYIGIKKYIRLKIRHQEPNVDMSSFCFKVCEDRKKDLIKTLKRSKYQISRSIGDDLDIGIQHSNCFIEMDEENLISDFVLDYENVIESIKDEKRKEVFRMMVMGFTYKEIMDELNISLNILKKYNKLNREFLRRYSYVGEKIFAVETVSDSE